jgi:hypothetical protein
LFQCPADPSYQREESKSIATPIGAVREFTLMKAILGSVALSLAVATTAVPADAKGCIKGAIAGGVAGHYAHHHALIGAAVGCVVGHHLAKEKEKAEKEHAQDPNR